MSLPAIVSALTTLFAFGSQVRSAVPVSPATPVADSFARWLRVWPPIDEKSPPTKRLEPESASARTGALALGFQSGSGAAPVPAALSFAMNGRFPTAPLIVMKVPPAYTLVPSVAIASTLALALGVHPGSAAPDPPD